MTDTSKTVFISYRRRSANWVTPRVAEYLRNYGYDVFFDKDLGVGRFDTRLVEEIQK